ncbi:ImmA/IrrE family metallo-endopeptidase [Cellulomonas sp. NPDC058312]|uniref:ImmA/IrrE family metallo-endopeptidase n=1 Tax=Cellulomonas sp. NPDC058312 TaxID=3346441 RepID=UPI0036E6EF45
MTTAPPAARDIDDIVDDLLVRAGAVGRFPTPVEEIVAAAGLAEAQDYVLTEEAIAQAPAQLRELLRSSREKILGLVDRRERVIHVSPTITHGGRRSFVKLHEVTHHVLPWQRELVYADDDDSLSPSVRAQFEREANYGAAALLFQGSQFDESIVQLPVRLESIDMLAGLFGASFRATARRYGERHSRAVLIAAFDGGEGGRWQRREVSASPEWRRRFGTPAWPGLMTEDRFPVLAHVRQGSQATVTWRDQNGESAQVRVAGRAGAKWASYLLLTVA